LLHLFCVNLDNFLLLDNLVVDDSVFFHDLLGIDSGIEGVELLLELSNLLLVFTKEGIFGVLVDTWLVLDVFGTTSIP